MGESLVVRLARLSPGEREVLLAGLDDEVVAGLLADWRVLARPEQLQPVGEWITWLFMAGRGAGKTRSACEWVHDRIVEHFEVFGGSRTHRIALAGRAIPDVRDVIVEGESGILAVSERRGLWAKFEPSKRRIVWPDLGAVATTFTAEEPDQARGPEFHTVWADEIATWDFSKTDAMGNGLWSNLMLALRLGDDPRAVVTTTPKRVPIVRELKKRADDPDDKGVVMTHAATMANKANLSKAFLDEIHTRYAGTRLAKQELEGILLEDVEGALWTNQMILDAHAVPDVMPEYGRRVVAVDPPTGVGRDECGIVVCALADLPAAPSRQPGPGVIVIEDATTSGTPEQWGIAAVEAATRHGCNHIVAESNQGGEMVRHVIRNADPSGMLNIELVRAVVGKRLRAEPVSQLYEQRRVLHETEFPELEDQMISWTTADRDSPDRLDALVHAVTALLPQIVTRPGSAHGPGLLRRIPRPTRDSNVHISRGTRGFQRQRLDTRR